MGAGAVPTGPDLSEGVELGRIPAEGVLAGQVGDASVLVTRVGGETGPRPRSRSRAPICVTRR